MLHVLARDLRHRVSEAVILQGEEAAKAADVADHLRPERGAHVLLDQLDGLLAGGGVNAGVCVGERIALPVES